MGGELTGHLPAEPQRGPFAAGRHCHPPGRDRAACSRRPPTPRAAGAWRGARRRGEGAGGGRAEGSGRRGRAEARRAEGGSRGKTAERPATGFPHEPVHLKALLLPAVPGRALHGGGRHLHGGSRPAEGPAAFRWPAWVALSLSLSLSRCGSAHGRRRTGRGGRDPALADAPRRGEVIGSGADGASAAARGASRDLPGPVVRKDGRGGPRFAKRGPARPPTWIKLSSHVRSITPIIGVIAAAAGPPAGPSPPPARRCAPLRSGAS